MSEFTKGPWKLEMEDTFDEDGSYLGPDWNQSIVGPNYEQEFGGEKQTVRDVVCVLGFSAHQCHKANAHLIAAAPEMYEALKHAKQFIQNGIDFGFIRMPDEGDPAHDTLPSILKTLSKAEGR